ncbi:MAG: hypothetical protein OZSIB_3906 [Candidatus Ozemobacter sibiricus]|uniref:Uncharacterized protein n=1 Tax=Candidatus Ozemobacter sibiricus TaxID=2268124 RepID=A0A367ZQW3_9BACT|nr:MAG: hypothetical protein OZSIB_3906 [Candidatus Ozemobacter sibiricus]
MINPFSFCNFLLSHVYFLQGFNLVNQGFIFFHVEKDGGASPTVGNHQWSFGLVNMLNQ